LGRAARREFTPTKDNIMGDRAQIKIEDSGVFLYTHWNGTKLKSTLKQALARGQNRWRDSEYLTRIIFCEMLMNNGNIVATVAETTGYGISTSKHGDIEHNLLVVSCENQTVTELDPDNNEVKVDPISFKDFITA
jgi:hypothetical protein